MKLDKKKFEKLARIMWHNFIKGFVIGLWKGIKIVFLFLLAIVIVAAIISLFI